MALGATMENVRWLILRSGLRLALVGAGLGLAAAIGITKLLGSMMPAVAGGAGVAVAEAMTFLTVVSLLASYLPARAALPADRSPW